MSSSNSPCAAYKLQRRKCTQECVFAPYFPPDNPDRFLYVHKVFGASNVAKILAELDTSQREDAVKSLAYEAEARVRDPVYGCVGLISILQHKLKVLQTELHRAKAELATYVGHQAMQPTPQTQGMMTQLQTRHPPSLAGFPYNSIHTSSTGIGHGGQFVVRESQMLEALAHLTTPLT